MGHELGSGSVYKQYTYARNVIQWNLDIFNDGRQTESGVKLRDDVTEGYNIIPNFFISAKLNEHFDYTTSTRRCSLRTGSSTATRCCYSTMM